MAGVTAQLLSAVSDEKNYRTVRLRLVVLCFCYASLCLNLVAPIGTIFLTIRFGSMPAEQAECLTTWFNHPEVGIKYLSPSSWFRQSRLGIGTFILVFSCKFPLIAELSDVSHLPRVVLILFWYRIYAMFSYYLYNCKFSTTFISGSYHFRYFTHTLFPDVYFFFYSVCVIYNWNALSDIHDMDIRFSEPKSICAAFLEGRASESVFLGPETLWGFAVCSALGQ